MRCIEQQQKGIVPPISDGPTSEVFQKNQRTPEGRGERHITHLYTTYYTTQLEKAEYQPLNW